MATADESAVAEEHLCFYDPNFIAASPLSADNILDYFAASQFYDRGCLNQILRMQSQFTGLNIQHKLTVTPGFYYILDHQADGLFIIAKKHFDGARTTILRLYYSIHGYVYAAPALRAVSETRLIDGLWALNSALDRREEQAQFNWRRGAEPGPEHGGAEGSAADDKFILEALHDFEKHLRE